MQDARWDLAIIDQAFQFMGLLDLDGNLVTANQTALSFIGQQASGVLGRPFWETPWWRQTPDAEALLREAIRTSLQGSRFRAEVINTDGAGQPVVLDFSLTAVRDASGSLAWLLAEGRDITTFAHDRDALAREEAKFRSLFLRSKDGMLLLEGDRFTDCNPAVLEMMRCTEPEFLRLHPWDLSPPLQPDGRPSQTKALAMIAEAHARGGHRFEWVHRRADGTDFPVEVTLIPIPLQGRDILYTTWRDITARKAAEASLITSEARFRTVAELTGQAIYDRDLTTGRTIWAGALEAITGEPASTFEGPDVSAWISRVDPEAQMRVASGLRDAEIKGGPFRLEYRFRHRDGTYRVLQDQGMVVTSPDGLRRSLGAVSDVTALRSAETERLELERNLLHAQKLESLGLLAGGIAHDFNNLLTAVLGHANLIQDLLPPDHPGHRHLDAMDRSIQKASLLTRQMLAYSGRGKFHVAPLDVNETVAEIRSLMAASISKKVDVRLELAPELPAIEADVAQLQQVVLNLVTNASDAIGDAPGTITLRTLAVTLTPTDLPSAHQGTRLLPGRHVILEVEDTGCGMEPEVLARIFDPFFSTKATGRGLGLSAIQGILRGHGAALDITTAPGQGTTFRVTFRASLAPNPNATVEPERQTSPLNGLVLLVDDEEAILETSRIALERLGLEVLLARDGLEALAQVERHGARLSLVLLDLTMPRMDGREALLAIQKRRPELPILLCSGFSAQEAPIPQGTGRVTFLQKPYTLKALRKAVTEAMALQ